MHFTHPKGKVTFNLVGEPSHHYLSIAGSFLAHSVNITELLPNAGIVSHRAQLQETYLKRKIRIFNQRLNNNNNNNSHKRGIGVRELRESLQLSLQPYQMRGLPWQGRELMSKKGQAGISRKELAG